MSEELPPYDPSSECAKCGHDKASTRYDSGEHDLTNGCGVVVSTVRHGLEQIERTCCRCGYVWAEAVL